MPQQLVLIADDNPDTRLIFKLILEGRGFAVIQKVDGEEAVELAQLHRPDIVFMDLMMPVMAGWTAVERIRRGVPVVSRIPVVAVTAYDPPREKIRRAGFCGVATKPVTPTEVVRVAQVCPDGSSRGQQ